MRFFRDSIHDNIYGERISENMYVDSNGQLICENVVLARTGYYDYLESELIEGGSPQKIVKVYRSPEEVFDPVSMRSMNFKPLTDDHPSENVTPDTVGSLQKGFMTNVRRGDNEFSECLMADLVVTDPYVIDEIRSGRKRDLSVGYTADIVDEGGQFVMKNIRGNHIALVDAGRAGNARIRDSKPVVDAGEKYYATVEINSSHAEYMGQSDIANGEAILKSAVRNSGVVFKRSWFKNFYLGSQDQVRKFVNECRRLDDYFYLVSEPKLASESVLRNLGDSKSMLDFVAKGSFNSLEELKKFYPSSIVEENGDKNVIVRLNGSTQLLYSYIPGSGRLFFVRKADPLRDSVEVLGDKHMMREGQRVRYFGEPCVVSRIEPDLVTGDFSVEFKAGDIVCGRLGYKDVVTNIEQGKIQLMDSVVFDSKADKFTLVPNKNYADCFRSNYSACFVDKNTCAVKDADYSVGQKLWVEGLDGHGVIEKVTDKTVSFSVGRSMQTLSKDRFNFGVKNGSIKLLDSARKKVSDAASTLKPFAVSVGDRKFVTRAVNAADAVHKVTRKLADKSNAEFASEWASVLRRNGFVVEPRTASPWYRGPGIAWMHFPNQDAQRALSISRSYAEQNSLSYMKLGIYKSPVSDDELVLEVL